MKQGLGLGQPDRNDTGPSQWISIDGFKVLELLNVLRVPNPELYYKNKLDSNVSKESMGSNEPIESTIYEVPAIFRRQKIVYSESKIPNPKYQ